MKREKERRWFSLFIYIYRYKDYFSCVHYHPIMWDTPSIRSSGLVGCFSFFFFMFDNIWVVVGQWNVRLIDLELSHILLLLFIHEIQLGGCTLQHAVPVQVSEGAFLDDFTLYPACKLGGWLIFLLELTKTKLEPLHDKNIEFYKIITYPLFHGWQIIDINNNCPAGHHQQEILQHGVLVAVPEGITEPQVILDSDWIDRRIDFEAAFLEHHDGCIVNARALWKYQNRLVRFFFYMLPHSSRNKTYINHSYCSWVQEIYMCMVKWLLPLSLDSDLSNQMCFEAREKAFCIIPVNPPCFWPIME